MADKKDAYSDNVAGPYYCDSQCIDCSLCNEIAPTHFIRNNEEGHDFVFKQPITEAEREICEEALRSCPVNAIGRDGDK
jgi:ferredoxin